MKSKFTLALFSLAFVGSAAAQGLYYVGSEAQDSMPLKWVVGLSATYDDNVSPGTGPKQDSFGLNPSVGLSFVSITPQTTWDVYARLGLLYYLDAPAGADDVNSQSRAGINLTHRFNERLRFSSRNFISYELQPDYSYGYATSAQNGEYFYWQSDNSIGFRWSERFATYTGISLTGFNYADVANNNRFTWQLYNQGRYQLGPQTVLTGDYRYAQTAGDGVSSDYTDQYLLAGVEQRFSPNTIGILRVGAQFHDVDAGSNSTSPYLEMALNSRINEQFRLRAFARYGIEGYDTVQTVTGIGTVDYDDRRTFRLGISGDYSITPTFSVFGGLDYIPTAYNGGRRIVGVGSVPDQNENIYNAYIGLSMKLTDYLTGTATYNYTNSTSDFAGRDYDRNRISIGVSTEF